jgi:nitrite reductase (NO-forming)
MRPSSLLAVFFAAGLAMLAGGGAAAVTYAAGAGSGDELRWVALHLTLLSGVSQLVLGAAQFFVCAFLATDPPPRRLLGAQLATWNAGTLLVATGVPLEARPLVDAGGALIVAGLVLFALGLRGMQKRSLQQARWAVRWYQACAACLGAGALIGVAMADDVTWTAGSLLGAHLALNLGGWLGTAIVGTLHTFFPSLTGTRLRFPRLQGPTFVLWLLGVAALAVGAAYDVAALVALGWLELAAAAALLGANMAASLLAAPRPLRLPARLLAAGHAMLLAGTLVALAASLADNAHAPFTGAWRDTSAALLLAGWIGLTVAGSLLHLLSVLRRVRAGHPPPTPRPWRDRLLAGAATVAIALLAAGTAGDVRALRVTAGAATLAVTALLAFRIAALAAAALRPGSDTGPFGAPPRPRT